MAPQPIHIWNHVGGPNPKKVVMILEELGVPYELENISDPKIESFLKVNPNGRLPAIRDPNNNDLILWESGAIVEYLIETYDKDNILSIPTSPEKWLIKQYLHFQASGQGPYYGQGIWFHHYHEEDVPTAKKRYIDQIVRVWSVLDKILEGKKYLVGDRLTYVDLCFVPWEVSIYKRLGEELKEHDPAKNYPNYWAWYQNLVNRPSVEKAYNP